MKITSLVGFLLFTATLCAQSIESPSKSIRLDFKLTAEGRPSYSVFYKGKSVVKSSGLGIKLKGADNLVTQFSIDSIGSKSVSEAWHPVL